MAGSLRHRRVAAAAVLAALGLLAVFGSILPDRPAAAQGVRYVDDEAGCRGLEPCYASIQAAVDAALPGETVQVAAGHYTETVLLVDKSLVLHGPESVIPAGRDDPERHALWAGRAAGQPGVALTVDARSVDLSGLVVRGFRFRSARNGLLLLGREPGDPAGLPAGLPTSTLATRIVGANVAFNRFDLGGPARGGPGASAAMVAYFSRNLRVDANRFDGGVGGLYLAGAEGARIVENRFEDNGGNAIELRIARGDLELARNVVLRPGEIGVELHDLSWAGRPATVSEVRLEANTVTGAGAAALRVEMRGGGALDSFRSIQNTFENAGRLGGLPGGAVQLRGAAGSIASIHMDRDRVVGSSGGRDGIEIEGPAVAADLGGLRVADNQGAGLSLTDIRELWLHRSEIGGNALGIRLVETDRSDPVAARDLKIGGFAEAGNRLGGNAGASLVLVNQSARSAATHGVDARYNDWNSAYSPPIEERIVHAPDDPRLGTVDFLPALRVPVGARLSAQPSAIVADGLSQSTVTASFEDLRGEPVADGTLVRFETSAGLLARPGGVAEAEDPSLARGGAWTQASSSSFGPFSGAGYLRGSAAGATLRWTQDAPAFLLRYGRSPLANGRFRVLVDGEERALVSTRGATRSWVEQVVVSGLEAGPRELTIELLEGELNLDQLVAGRVTRAGSATIQLRSSVELGSATVRAQAHGAGGQVAGSTSVVFVPGAPVTIALRSAASTLELGSRTAVTATLRDARGRAVRDGIEVSFRSSRGEMQPPRVATKDGLATAQFFSRSRLGVAMLQASASGVTASLPITLTAGRPAAIVITPTRATMPANSFDRAGIRVYVRDDWGNPVADGTAVSLEASLGRVLDPLVSTVNGRAYARYIAGSEAGTAILAGRVGDISVERPLRLEPLDVRLHKSVEPRSAVVPGERVTYTLRFEHFGSGPILDLDVVDRLPTGLISPSFRSAFVPRGPVLENRGGSQPFAFRVDRMEPRQVGFITVTARIDTSLAWGPQNTIRNIAQAGAESAAEAEPEDNRSSAEVKVVPGAVYQVALDSLRPLKAGGQTAEVRARVFDREGNPAADGTAVFFAVDDPDVGAVAPAVSQTRGGIARATFFSGERAAETVLRAVSIDERGASTRVEVLPEVASSLMLAAARPRLEIGGKTTEITATFQDRFGNGVPDTPVRFEAERGEIRSAASRSGAMGVATATLASDARIGVAMIRAYGGDLEAALEMVFTAGDPAGLSLEIAQPELVVGSRTQVVARVIDAFGNPVPGIRVEFDSDIGILARRRDNTDAMGRADTEVLGPRPGRGSVRAEARGLTAEAQLEVRRANAFLPRLSRH